MSVRRAQSLPGDCPITWGLILAHAVMFLAAFFGFAGELRGALAFQSGDALGQAWTFLTYPVVADAQILSVLLGSYVLWLFGGSLERGWGPRGYLPFLLLVTAAPSIALWVASATLSRAVALAGLWLPLSGIVYAWTVVHPRERILLYMVLPIEARWLGVLTLAVVFFGIRPFPLGAFALAGCGLAGLYVRSLRFGLSLSPRRPAPRVRLAEHRRERQSINPIARLRKWQRKRKFIRMMDESGLRDLDPK